MKGGINMINKKASAYALLGLVVLQVILSVSFVAAQSVTTKSSVITEPSWLVSIAKFMGFINNDGNVTWAIIVASVAVLAMIFAATYDILEFTAFESSWVKFVIAASIAMIVAVADGITFLTALIMSIAGGSVAIGTTLAIIFAVGFFLVTTWAKGKAKKFKAKNQAAKAEAGFIEAANALQGLKNVEKAAAKKE